MELKTMISVEFFPPKTTKGIENLSSAIDELQQIKPAYHSVTYGAGGSGQNFTQTTVLSIQKKGFTVAPHISCVNSTKSNIKEQLDQYKNNQIDRLVVLRGDLPSGAREYGEFNYASELVEFINIQYQGFFKIEVAAYPEQHPQTLNPITDIKNFKKKIDAGATGAITQYFYNPDSFYQFIDECQKQQINIPIVAGIMPITNSQNLKRFSQICGAEIPRYLNNYLNLYEYKPDELIKWTTPIVAKMCQNLIDNNVAGLHFYTMNKARPTTDIYNLLKL
ncbi:MAG: methylenetetrahydrofolate reductase [NAD(P)H] [Gammaproteobacteria bacterium]|nr:MAG: methylenetetrahydrofolate reductase [NAD(P)H] [Gammaproteobacteria bacterium]